MDTKDKRTQWAQYRFAVIAPLVCRRLADTERRELRRQILNQIFIQPDGQEKKVAARTLSEWVARYQKLGFDGLLAIERATAEQSRTISEEILSRAVELRQELPSRSAKTIIGILRAENFDVSHVARSTLNSHLTRRGATRQYLSPERGAFQRWEQDHTNALWQADTSSGLWLPNPALPRELKQTRLISFIDDASRVCTHAEFYFDEKLPSLIDCFRKALLKRGKPERLLCDNAFIYHSHTMKYMCARLGIETSFCEAYSPEGKGKIEKKFGTIKAAFYKEAEHSGITTLEELNQFFWAWLTKEYHHAVHSSLSGLTPVQRWCRDEQSITRVATEDIRRALMLRADRKVNIRTATVRLENNSYQLDSSLAGTTVEVRWDIHDTGKVEVWKKGKLIETAPLVVPGRNIDFARKPVLDKNPKRGITLSSSKRYRQFLIEQHQTEKPIAQPKADDYLSEPEFINLVARLLQRSLDAEELSFLARFFYENSPLRQGILESLLTQAINAKGTKMHLRFYCHHVRVALFKQRR